MSKRTTYALIGVFVLLLVLSRLEWGGIGRLPSPPRSTPTTVDITNSVYLSQDDFPDGAPAAVLAGSDGYTDLVGRDRARQRPPADPCCSPSSTSLSPSARTELVRLEVSKVYIVGLSTTIVDAVKAALPSLAADKFVVLAGADAYQTRRSSPAR